MASLSYHSWSMKSYIRTNALLLILKNVCVFVCVSKSEREREREREREKCETKENMTLPSLPSTWPGWNVGLFYIHTHIHTHYSLSHTHPHTLLSHTHTHTHATLL